ncbi:MAG: 6,7-dimethyl-8-ribityllumazine synthase [Ferruginibacter sp.]
MAISTQKLTNTIGIQLTKDAFVVIVKTEWNANVVDLLQEGCVRILSQNNINYKIIEVPGAFEIPFAVKNYWVKAELAADVLEWDDISEYPLLSKVKMPDAFIALGCVIRGGTPHFDYVCDGVTQGIMNLNISLPVPIIYGVLTVNNQLQADERLGGLHGHKGEEAAAAAVKMIALCNDKYEI